LVARGPKGANVTEAVAGALAGLKPPVQVQALAVLRERGDKAAVSAARAALKSERAAVRGEAARLLGALGGDEDAAGLIALAAAQDDAGAAARESLATMACARVDELLLGQLSTGDAAAKKQAIGLLAARGCKTLTEKLYDEKLFADADLAQAAAAAIRALGGKDEFARALAFAAKLPADKRGPLVGVLSPLAQRTGDAARCVADVQKAIAALPEGDRVSLIGVLASVPCAESLQALDVLLKETNVEIRKEAVRTLGKWENAQPAELLLNAAKGDADQTVRILAVRSAAFVLGRPKSVARPEDGVALVKRAVDVAERPDEKKAALAALGAFKCKAAVEYAESLKADAVLGSAAGDALRKLQAK
jgi:HEAT repeat protein